MKKLKSGYPRVKSNGLDNFNFHAFLKEEHESIFWTYHLIEGVKDLLKVFTSMIFSWSDKVIISEVLYRYILPVAVV